MLIPAQCPVSGQPTIGSCAVFGPGLHGWRLSLAVVAVANSPQIDTYVPPGSTAFPCHPLGQSFLGWRLNLIETADPSICT